MKSSEKRVSIHTLERRLRVLDKAPEIAKAVISSMEPHSEERSLERVIYDGYQELIDLFNSYKPDIHDDLAPNVLLLKELLGDAALPSITDPSAKDLVEGLAVSRELMLEGQELKSRRSRGITPTQKETDHAIGAPSVDTDPRALAIGTAGHIIERTLMAHLKRMGLNTSEWVKDQILWALEDLALLQHAESQTYGTDDAMLFEYFTSAPGPNGGMGWRKPEAVQHVVDRYQDHETSYKIQLFNALRRALKEINDEELERFGEDISMMPFNEALGYTFTYLLEEGIDPEEALAEAGLIEA